VLSWGFGWAGQLGHGDEATLLAPRCIDGALPLGARATAVAAGANHSLARCADGAFYSWGSGLGGRLGRAGSDRRERRPVRLDYLDS
jgi:alpha-tubulin suppressor-like RCC1 family protein